MAPDVTWLVEQLPEKIMGLEGSEPLVVVSL